MKPSSDHRARLVAETVHGDWAAGPAAEFAWTAAAHARRLRRTRRALTASGTLAALAIAAVLGGLRSPAPVEPLRDTSNPLGYEIISDQELAALLPDQPLLIVSHGSAASEIVLLGN